MEKMVISFKVLALLACVVLCCQSRPMGGIHHDIIYSLNSSATSKFNGTCHEIGFYNGGTIRVKGKVEVIGDVAPKDGISVEIGFKLFQMTCANFLDMPAMKGVSCSKLSSLENRFSGFLTLVASGHITKKLVPGNEEAELFILHPVDVLTPTPLAVTDITAVVTNDTASATTPSPGPPPKIKRETVSGKKKGEKGKDQGSKDKSRVQSPPPVVTIGNATTGSGAGMYLLQVYISRQVLNRSSILVAHADIEMRNRHGYLSAVDYPALVFYGVMTSVYAIYGIAWIVMMLCSFSDLVRLQFWVMAVIILGFLEKTFFVAEYSTINLGNDTYGSYVVAEFVSAVKRGLSRMLLIIVAMGFGTVKPRLGDSLFKVVAAGVAYFSLALVDGIMRSRASTFHTSDTSSVVTLALLLLLDTFIFYWIFTAIVDTRRTLRLRKNYVKLAMYNHFAYTLIFAILATVGFIIWVFVALEFPSGLCLTDWREAWVRDCFWHVLFAFILLVVMVIWRPSSNRSRFAYSLVADEEEVVFEQGSNKNFETVKMRTVNKDSPPPVTSQAEDDLRWVEENLPTTAMDKALPLILDSDEEVMTTKFEMSKMN